MTFFPHNYLLQIYVWSSSTAVFNSTDWLPVSPGVPPMADEEGVRGEGVRCAGRHTRHEGCEGGDPGSEAGL